MNNMTIKLITLHESVTHKGNTQVIFAEYNRNNKYTGTSYEGEIPNDKLFKLLKPALKKTKD